MFGLFEKKHVPAENTSLAAAKERLIAGLANYEPQHAMDLAAVFTHIDSLQEKLSAYMALLVRRPQQHYHRHPRMSKAVPREDGKTWYQVYYAKNREKLKALARERYAREHAVKSTRSLPTGYVYAAPAGGVTPNQRGTTEERSAFWKAYHAKRKAAKTGVAPKQYGTMEERRAYWRAYKAQHRSGTKSLSYYQIQKKRAYLKKHYREQKAKRLGIPVSQVVTRYKKPVSYINHATR